MKKNDKIFLTGHRGMLGSTTQKLLIEKGYTNIITKTHKELDLTNQNDVEEFFKTEKPQFVIHIAAKVGGIKANIDNPAIFLYDNLIMQANVINSSYKNGVEKFVFIASSCIYPKDSPQPMKEEYLLDGKLEPTNEGYAIGKIAGIKLLETYNKQYGFNGISLIPSNLYGPNDTFDLNHAHVLSSLVKKIVDAKDNLDPSITLWGTGIARREFLHVEDFSKAVIHFFENYNSPYYINVGPGEDISISELAKLIVKKVGFEGDILWDETKPNGMLRKCMDVTNMQNENFMPKISLEEGIDQVIISYKKQKNEHTINAKSIS
ncbi:GDP-L-fucose synthase [Flavobacterium araucananum]|uniref:GDP-L-fucose synthase n=1 Tax=Flavobacterium araucananum TaxID=946678 RepID=A0A227PFW1_9FLAO|nr:GDP-L-fucose synthase [Flavobacterium araucananum]OXG08769.1 GDP-fucose synthetase [Flavobacterium araucananum]PWJ97741.1 GDP-L-fucose synthase [Flavobacterium araucananum]